MNRLAVRTLGGFVAAVVVGWWLRMMAHSKKPPAEGRWRELDLERTR